jgi:hypothetical protein
MAAGLGFKDFVTGEVLTAADVDGYLMQGVWVFASAAARDAAVTSPQEGNFAYLKDTNVTTYYTGSAWANLDTTGMTNPMTTTGDTIYSSSGSTPARLGIGSTGQVLTVAGGIPSWATPAAGTPTFVGASAYSTDQSIPNATYTAVNWSAENFDTNAFHDNSTNNTRMTIPAGKGGYYEISFQAILDGNTTGNRVVRLYKNGSYFRQSRVGTSGATPVSTILVNLSLVATDYIEIYVLQTSGGNLTYELIDTSGWFNITYLGA